MLHISFVLKKIYADEMFISSTNRKTRVHHNTNALFSGAH